jgi:hypothetical protein
MLRSSLIITKALTAARQDVLIYARAGDVFAYLASADADLQTEQAWLSAGPGIPDITVGTATPLMPRLYPHFKATRTVSLSNSECGRCAVSERRL